MLRERIATDERDPLKEPPGTLPPRDRCTSCRPVHRLDEAVRIDDRRRPRDDRGRARRDPGPARAERLRKTTFLRRSPGSSEPTRVRSSSQGGRSSGTTCSSHPSAGGLGSSSRITGSSRICPVNGNVGFGVEAERPEPTRSPRPSARRARRARRPIPARALRRAAATRRARAARSRRPGDRSPRRAVFQPRRGSFASAFAEEVRTILRTTGTSTVFGTHDQEEAFDIADRIAVMNEGRIEQLGRTGGDLPHTGDAFRRRLRRRRRFLAGRGHRRRARDRARCLSDERDRRRARTGSGSCSVRRTSGSSVPGKPSAPEVVGRRFKGVLSLSTVRLQTGRIITGADSSQEIFTPGERVDIRFRPDHLARSSAATAASRGSRRGSRPAPTASSASSLPRRLDRPDHALDPRDEPRRRESRLASFLDGSRRAVTIDRTPRARAQSPAASTRSLPVPDPGRSGRATTRLGSDGPFAAPCVRGCSRWTSAIPTDTPSSSTTSKDISVRRGYGVPEGGLDAPSCVLDRREETETALSFLDFLALEGEQIIQIVEGRGPHGRHAGRIARERSWPPAFPCPRSLPKRKTGYSVLGLFLGPLDFQRPAATLTGRRRASQTGETVSPQHVRPETKSAGRYHRIFPRSNACVRACCGFDSSVAG